MKTTTRHKFLTETISAIPGYLDVNRNGVDPFGTVYTSENPQGVSSPGIFPFTFSPQDSIWLMSAKMECEVENGLIQCVDTATTTENYCFKVAVGFMNPNFPPDHVNLSNLHFKGFEKIECRHRPTHSPFILPVSGDGLIHYVIPYFRLEVNAIDSGAEANHVFKTDLLDSSLIGKRVSYSIVCEWEHSFRPVGM